MGDNETEDAPLKEAREVDIEALSMSELLALVVKRPYWNGYTDNKREAANYKAWEAIQAAKAAAEDEIAAARVTARRFRKLDADVPLDGLDPRRVEWRKTLWARLGEALKTLGGDSAGPPDDLREIRAELRTANTIVGLLSEEQAALDVAKTGAPNPAPSSVTPAEATREVIAELVTPLGRAL